MSCFLSFPDNIYLFASNHSNLIVCGDLNVDLPHYVYSIQPILQYIFYLLFQGQNVSRGVHARLTITFLCPNWINLNQVYWLLVLLMIFRFSRYINPTHKKISFNRKKKQYRIINETTTRNFRDNFFILWSWRCTVWGWRWPSNYSVTSKNTRIMPYKNQKLFRKISVKAMDD